MPICETQELPLVGGGLSDIAASGHSFFIVHVMSRMEKMFAAECGAAGLPYFVPLVTAVRYSGRGSGPKKKYKVREPLFPGYVFVGAPPDRDGYRFAQADVMAMPFERVIRTIPVLAADQDQFRAELHNLHRGLESDYPVEPFPYLIQGTRCRIKYGPLENTEGVVFDRKERTGEYRIVLQVTMLQKGVLLELDASEVEPL